MHNNTSDVAIFKVSSIIKIFSYIFGLLLFIPGIALLLNGLIVASQQNAFNVFLGIALPFSLFFILPSLYFIFIPIRFKIIIDKDGLTSVSLFSKRFYFFGDIYRIIKYKERTQGLSSSIVWVEFELKSGIRTKLKLNNYKKDDSIKIMKFLNSKISNQ